MQCAKCGGTGILDTGDPCDCVMDVKSFFTGVIHTEVPERYQQMVFSKMMLPKDVHESYGIYLEELHDNIVSRRLRNMNIFIGSPVNHGKTVFAYAMISELASRQLEIFPLFDVLELNSMLCSLDSGKPNVYNVERPERILTCPVLFAYIPNNVNIEVYNAIALILSRRVRRGNMTIFLFEGTWEQFVKMDYRGLMKDRLGDGYGNTILNKTWSRGN